MSYTGTIPQSEKSHGLGIITAAFSRILNVVARYLPMYPSTRAKIQRLRGVKMGKDVFIGADVMFDEVYPENITIEDKVTIIARSTILSHSFYPSHFKKALSSKKSSTILKEGCYLGLGSIIMPGVVVGKYSIIGAGSIITKDVPNRAIIYGNPAAVRGYTCKCGYKLAVNTAKHRCK